MKALVRSAAARAARLSARAPTGATLRTGAIVWAMILVHCGGSVVDVRYPQREAGCPVQSFPARPPVPVDELGTVVVECRQGHGGCERQALDEVCRRGGDVAWGFADNALTATKLVVHAAHTHRSLEGPRPAGCVVHVFEGAPTVATENVGEVAALCSMDDPRDACLRELMDQVCRLGGDALWQVEGPTPVNTSEGAKQRMRGRAAHSK